MVTKRETIARRLVTDFEAISTGGGYETTVKNVFRRFRGGSEIEAAKRPAIALGSPTTSRQPMASEKVIVTATWPVYCYGQKNLDASANDDTEGIAALKQDVIKAVWDDRTLNGNTIQVRPNPATPDLTDNTETNMDGGAVGVVLVEVKYEAGIREL